MAATLPLALQQQQNTPDAPTDDVCPLPILNQAHDEANTDSTQSIGVSTESALQRRPTKDAPPRTIPADIDRYAHIPPLEDPSEIQLVHADHATPMPPAPPQPVFHPNAWQCPHCSYWTKRKDHFNRHLRTHDVDAVKRFKCDYCDYRTDWKRNLKVHTRTHTGEKPFVCSYCDRGFTTKGGMQGHERRHTGEKPYPCTGCDKRFRTASQMKIHFKKHHM